MNIARNISFRGVAPLSKWFGTSRDLPSIDVERVLELARILSEKNRPLDLTESNVIPKPRGARNLKRE